MILVDTSIWIDHLNRGGVEQLGVLLESEGVVMHRFVIGEIAMGSLKNRAANLAFLRDLHRLPSASDAEVSALIEWGKLHGTGLGYIDAHMLAAARASSDSEPAEIWTRDKRLHAQAERLGVAFHP